MTRPVRHYERQDEIASAASEVICKKGIRNTGLRDIANHMGVTTGKIQHYFDSKQELLQFTANYSVDQMFIEASSNSARATGSAKLSIFCESLLPLTKRRYCSWQVAIAFNGATIGDSGLTDFEIDRYETAQKKFASIIRELQNDGDLPSGLDPSLAGYSLVAFVEGLAMQIVFSRSRYKTPNARQVLAEYLRQVFGI